MKLERMPAATLTRGRRRWMTLLQNILDLIRRYRRRKHFFNVFVSIWGHVNFVFLNPERCVSAQLKMKAKCTFIGGPNNRGLLFWRVLGLTNRLLRWDVVLKTVQERLWAFTNIGLDLSVESEWLDMLRTFEQAFEGGMSRNKLPFEDEASLAPGEGDETSCRTDEDNDFKVQIHLYTDCCRRRGIH